MLIGVRWSRDYIEDVAVLSHSSRIRVRSGMRFFLAIDKIAFPSVDFSSTLSAAVHYSFPSRQPSSPIFDTFNKPLDSISGGNTIGLGVIREPNRFVRYEMSRCRKPLAFLSEACNAACFSLNFFGGRGEKAGLRASEGTVRSAWGAIKNSLRKG